MSHFAQLDKDNVVIQVVVGNNNHPDEGYAWIVKNLGGRWIQTSYNATIRKNFAGVGFIYDEELDAFIPPKPYASWLFNAETCNWDPPINAPEDDKSYWWDEENQSWVVIPS